MEMQLSYIWLRETNHVEALEWHKQFHEARGVVIMEHEMALRCSPQLYPTRLQKFMPDLAAQYANLFCPTGKWFIEGLPISWDAQEVQHILKEC